jgi:hypothetical protein
MVCIAGADITIFAGIAVVFVTFWQEIVIGCFALIQSGE